MNIYSEFLLNKEKRDNELDRQADNALRNDMPESESSEQIAYIRMCVQEILNRFEIDPLEVRNCNSAEEILNAMLDPLDILYQKIDMKDKNWRSQSAYILAFTADGSPLVLAPSVFGYNYYNPANLRRGLVTKKLELGPEGYMVFRPLESGEFSMKSFVSLLLHLISPRDIPCMAAASLAVTLLGLVAPTMNKRVLTQALELGEGALPYLFSSATVFVLAGIFKGIFGLIKSLILGRMKQRVSIQMQSAIMGKLLLMPYDYFTKGDTGRLSNQVRNGSRLSGMIIDFAMGNLLGVVFSLVYIPQMKGLAADLVIPALLFLLVRMLLSMALTIASARHTAKTIAIEQDSESFVFDVLKGIQKVQSMGAQKRVYSRIAGKYRNVLSAEINPPIMIRLSGVYQSFISGLASAMILIIAAYSNVSQPDYVAFTASYALITNAVSSLVKMVNSLVTMKPLRDELSELFNYQGSEKGVEYVRTLGGVIELKDLCFSYTKSERGCVDHINLSINAGEKVAIVGESGCGKSTLLKLLLGMLTPDKGMILYDGRPLSTLNKRSLRKKIASVFQFTKVFPGSVYDNISFTSDNCSEQDAWDAARKAFISEEIRALPLGMDTEISEGNGGGFSGGQKQRLMIARAFAQKPSIMILDEATSALDNISQHEVLKSVYDLKCTVIMVAHRLSTVVGCDRIIMLQNGRIVEEGDYDTLIKRNGPFTELVKRQQEQAAST